MEFSVVSTQGRVVIPAKIRERLGIKPGIRLVFELKEGSFEIRPITESTIDSLKGMLKQDLGAKPATEMLWRSMRKKTEVGLPLAVSGRPARVGARRRPGKPHGQAARQLPKPKEGWAFPGTFQEETGRWVLGVAACYLEFDHSKPQSKRCTVL